MATMAEQITPEESGGWKNSFISHLKQKAHDAINDLHDRLVYTTKTKKQELEKDTGEEEPEAEISKGFQKAK